MKAEHEDQIYAMKRELESQKEDLEEKLRASTRAHEVRNSEIIL